MKKIYDKLYKKYGPQNWWPVTTKNQQFEVIIGTILTQNTSWKNVEKAIANLRKAKLIQLSKIANCNKKSLAKLIKPSGYFNQKADRLKIVANFFLKNKNLNKLPVNKLREKLLQVKGIGPETTDSIILYAYKKPSFVIDLYTKRIFSRLGKCKSDTTYEELQDLFHKKLKKDVKLFNEYHALIVEHAKQFCTKKPKCKDCFLKKTCKQKI